ncbi:gamma-glutamyltransferase [Lampropedia cohaerens]|uniref:Glutathione hydrolase proenzyme n=1 Tax=Lampropedia cohaerens TaxID=1610491 RepID=A0A0U1PX24_9BURK|nr:gamma-glutamyltransferase [Lampropedia cohaerens]
MQLCVSTVVAAATLAACGSSDLLLPGTPARACAITTSDGAVIIGSGLPGDPAAPEPASGYRVGMEAMHARDFMVVTANPLASRAGCEVLRDGGNAMDAAVAVQMVLGLVEPQSSGIGGGAFMLYYDAASGKVQAFDGRETAPAAATDNYLRWVNPHDDAAGTPQPSTRASGRSIGTPGVVRMLELAHEEYGSTPWERLFAPAIELAQEGFAVSGRMADALAAAREHLRRDPDAAALYLEENGQALALGARFTNPEYARTLVLLAQQGADAFYTGPVAQAIVDKIRMATSAADGAPITPGLTTLEDLRNYEAKKREAVCTSYRQRYLICGMPPPSSGGIAVASIMGILEHFNLAEMAPFAPDGEGGWPDADAVHLVAEAGRLAYADRDAYVADTDFVPLPGGSWHAMLDKTYLRARARLIDPRASMGRAGPGDFMTTPGAVVPVPEAGTSHVSIVDAAGNAVSMTTTVESSMGSYHVTRGFVLNNQLTDFAAVPAGADGTPVANRVQANKRPRSSMAPTLVFDLRADGSPGALRMATGSPGGSTIIQYVTKVLVGVLDWQLDAQQATNLVNFGAANAPTTNYGGEHPNVASANQGADDPVVRALQSRGHRVNLNAQTSGIATILRVQRGAATGWQGGADPRREGIALGDNAW